MVKSGNGEEIQRHFSRLNHEAEMIVKTSIELTYFMRGAISYEEIMRRSPYERQLISDFVKERLEFASKMMNPVF